MEKSEEKSQKSKMESVMAQPSSSIVKNLINRNPRVLSVARKLQNQKDYSKALEEKIKHRKELEMIRSLSPKDQHEYKSILLSE